MAYYKVTKKQSSAPSYTIEQGDTETTNTTTISGLEVGGFYLFNTVYGDSGFSGAEIVVGNASAIYTASGLGRVGCIVKCNSSTVTYSRSGDISSNEYTELIPPTGMPIGQIDSSWSSGTSISAVQNGFYFIALGNNEAGTLTGCDVLVENEMETTLSASTRYLIVKATSSTIQLNTSNAFYYRRIGLII